MFKLFLMLGSLNAFLTVALGAFGAHGLKGRISEELLAVYQTGVQYQGIHALGLILVAILWDRLPQPGLLGGAGWLMLAGIVLFSGSLYALSLSGVRALGAITPLGGLAFLAAWAMVFLAAWRA